MKYLQVGLFVLQVACEFWASLNYATLVWKQAVSERWNTCYGFFFERSCCWKVLFHWLLNRTENMDFCAFSDLSAYPFPCWLIWSLFFHLFCPEKIGSSQIWKTQRSKQHGSVTVPFSKEYENSVHISLAWFLLERREILSDFLPSLLGKLHQKNADEFIVRLSVWQYLLVCCKCLQC